MYNLTCYKIHYERYDVKFLDFNVKFERIYLPKVREVKETTVAIILILVCIGLRYLIDVFDKPEKVVLPPIENISIESLLKSNDKLFVENQILDLETDSILQTSWSAIKIDRIGDIYKYMITPSEDSDFVSMYDNLNLLLSENEYGINLSDTAMVIRQVKSKQDDFIFLNYGNNVINEIMKADSIDTRNTDESVTLLDMGLHSLNTFSNASIKGILAKDSIDSGEGLSSKGIRVLKLLPGTDSTNVLVTSESIYNSGRVLSEKISYNLKNNKFNEIVSDRIVLNKYKVRQVITR